VHDLALDSNGTIAIIGVITALWLASMGAAYKVATILTNIAGELKYLREDHNAMRAEIVTIQRRFNIPQAEDHDQAAVAQSLSIREGRS
jgi:hypothetical protein